MNVNGNIIGPLIELVDILDHMDVPVQTQCRVHGEERVIPVDIHAQRQSRIGHQGADGTQADDAQRLFIDLRSHKGGLSLFHHRGDIHTDRYLTADPLDAPDNIPGAHQHGAQHQLLNGVGIGAGGVEHRDARLGTAVQGDVVHTHTRPGDGQQILRKRIVVELGGPHQNAVLVLLVISNGIALRVEFVQPYRRDLVERFDVIHGT